MKRLILGIGVSITLASCSSFVDKKALSDDVKYVNYMNGDLTSSRAMWQQLLPHNSQVKVHILSQPMVFKPSCFTFMVGVNSKGDTEEIAVSHTYGDKQQLFSTAKRLRAQKWKPTKHNPDKLPAVVKIKTYSYSDLEPIPVTFKENCSDYLNNN
jgi:hypothetical protein